MQQKKSEFLDVTLNLENSSYRPYLKDNNKMIYSNTESNHPLSIIKQLLKSIELRLSQLSTNKEILKPYREALTKVGYKNDMRYQLNIRQNTTTNKNGKTLTL